MISKAQIKHIRSLHQKKYRDERQLFLAEGIKIVNELLCHQPESIELLVYTPGSTSQLAPHRLDQKQVIGSVAESDFKRISTQKTPQGVLAVVKQPSHAIPDRLEENSLSLVLEGIRDPGNLGTIIRLADWFGIENVFCSPDTVECFNPKVVQASMGAILRTRVYYTPLLSTLKKLNTAQSIYCYGTRLDGESIYEAKINTPAMLVLGSEANGMTDELSEFCTQNLLIPNYGQSDSGSESLNVSIAAGIVCAEFRRRLG